MFTHDAAQMYLELTDALTLLMILTDLMYRIYSLKIKGQSNPIWCLKKFTCSIMIKGLLAVRNNYIY